MSTPQNDPSMQPYPPQWPQSPPQVFVVQQRPPTSGVAVAALVLGFGGLCTLGFFSVFAVVCGHVALRDIRAAGGQLHGEGMAQAGLFLGYLVLVPAVVVLLAALGIGGVDAILH